MLLLSIYVLYSNVTYTYIYPLSCLFYVLTRVWWPCYIGSQFFNWGVFECDLAYRRSVAVLCMLHKIRCNPMHPFYGALPVPYVPVQVTRGAVTAHRCTYAPLRRRTSHYHRTLIPLSVSLWNDLSGPVFDGVGLAGFKSRANAFLLA